MSDKETRHPRPVTPPISSTISHKLKQLFGEHTNRKAQTICEAIPKDVLLPSESSSNEVEEPASSDAILSTGDNDVE